MWPKTCLTRPEKVNRLFKRLVYFGWPQFKPLRKFSYWVSIRTLCTKPGLMHFFRRSSFLVWKYLLHISFSPSRQSSSYIVEWRTDSHGSLCERVLSSWMASSVRNTNDALSWVEMMIWSIPVSEMSTGFKGELGEDVPNWSPDGGGRALTKGSLSVVTLVLLLLLLANRFVLPSKEPTSWSSLSWLTWSIWNQEDTSLWSTGFWQRPMEYSTYHRESSGQGH